MGSQLGKEYGCQLASFPGPLVPVSPKSWRQACGDFARGKLAVLDGAEYFTDCEDDGNSWSTVAGSPLAGGFIGGVIGLGLVNGVNTFRPKNGNATGMVDAARGYPWAVFSRGAVVIGGATVTHSFCTCIMGGNRFCWGYKGASSTAFYAAWTEDTTGAILNAAQVSTLPVLIHPAPDQNFGAIFDGTTVECYYGTGGTSDSTFLNPSPALIVEDVSNILITQGMFPGGHNRTSGGGTEYSNHACCLGITQSPR